MQKDQSTSNTTCIHNQSGLNLGKKRLRIGCEHGHRAREVAALSTNWLLQVDIQAFHLDLVTNHPAHVDLQNLDTPGKLKQSLQWVLSCNLHAGMKTVASVIEHLLETVRFQLVSIETLPCEVVAIRTPVDSRGAGDLVRSRPGVACRKQPSFN
jgi:hypothetical protein